jgi:hypothetical protein
MVSATTLVACFALAGCGDDEGGGDDDPGLLGIDDGAAQGVRRSALVRGDRDVTIPMPTGASVFIPMGAVTKPVKIGVERPSDGKAVPLLKDLGTRKAASAPYVLTPHGTQFVKDVKITLPVANASVGRRVQVATLENEQDTTWEILGVATALGRVEVTTSHFSVFVLVEELGQPDASVPQPTTDGGLWPSEAGPLPSDGGGVVGMDGAIAMNEGGTVDTSVQPVADAYVPRPDASAPEAYGARILSRMRTCNMLAREGEFSLDLTGRDTGDLCFAECLAVGPCADLVQEFCGDGELSDQFVGCWAACLGRSTVSCATESSNSVAVACDGYAECTSGQDEMMCAAGTVFACASGGETVASFERCNGQDECEDGSDELNCTNPSASFICSDGERLPSAWQCDGERDCTDGADELNCQGRTFTCTNGSATYPIRSVCDLESDCSDGSDEPSRCAALRCPL